jgi:hypothetical protein
MTVVGGAEQPTTNPRAPTQSSNKIIVLEHRLMAFSLHLAKPSFFSAFRQTTPPALVAQRLASAAAGSRSEAEAVGSQLQANVRRYFVLGEGIPYLGTQRSEQVEWRHETTQLAWSISQDKHRHTV